jgi:outer membrane immunogenic protein
MHATSGLGISMRNVWLGALGLAALSLTTPVLAADMAIPPAPPAAQVVVARPFYDWTGLYIGGNGGWGWSHACWNQVLAGVSITDGCKDISGGLLGGQLGFRQQWGSWVFGVEAQGNWADLNGSTTSIVNPLVTETFRIRALGLFTGQVGYAWDAALLYFKGGAAVTSGRFDASLGGAVSSLNVTRAGGSAGIGFEYAFAPNWSAGVEYDHLFMAKGSVNFPLFNPVLPGAATQFTQDVDIFTVRVNYRFGFSKY